jgi:diguanylate cyclase
VAVAAALAVALGRLRRRLREGEQRVVQLQEMAMTDVLTGLPNRRQWEQQLPRELARALRHEEPICVAILDLDRFKQYNDERGHLAGDRLLKQAASTWRSALRPYDLLARYGGEEFGLILPGCPLYYALRIVERLRAATPGGQSCSAGIAEWDRHDHAEVLVGRADAALYEAKLGGRDRTASAAHSQTTD